MLYCRHKYRIWRFDMAAVSRILIVDDDPDIETTGYIQEYNDFYEQILQANVTE